MEIATPSDCVIANLDLMNSTIALHAQLIIIITLLAPVWSCIVFNILFIYIFTDCDDAITCAGNGNCNVNGLCECKLGFDVSTNCSSCAPSHFNYPICSCMRQLLFFFWMLTLSEQIATHHQHAVEMVIAMLTDCVNAAQGSMKLPTAQHVRQTTSSILHVYVWYKLQKLYLLV